MSAPRKLRQSLPSLGRMLQRFAPYVRRHAGLVGFALLMLLLGVGIRLLEPWPLKLLFDGVFADRLGAGATPGVLANLATLDPVTLLTLCVVALFAILAARALTSYLSVIGFALVGNRVLTAVRSDLYRNLQRLSLGFHARARTGDLIVRVISDVGMLKDVAVTAALPLLGNLLILLGMVAVMFWMHWQLAAMAVLILPLFWLSTLRFGGRLRQVARKQRQREAALAATAAESVGAIKVVQALSLERMFERAFANQSDADLKAGVRAKRLAAGLERSADVLIALATTLVLWHGARLVLANELTPGDLLVFLFYLKAAFRPVRDLAKYTGRLAKASAAGERVLELLEATPEVQDAPDARPAPPFLGRVCFEGVSFGYEADHEVLRDISFDIDAGERVALVGVSGSGKSTIASLMLRLYDPAAGRITIDGSDLRDYTLQSLREQISVVLQEPLLFAASVQENIACGATGATDADVRAAVQLANADSFINALPDGFATILGERGVTLSAGQRQRLGIARAAVRKSAFLILDEPTAALDEGNQQAVSDALWRLARGRTTLLITHDLQQAARADRVLHLHDGRIIEQGTHGELMRARGRYAALYESQTKAARANGRALVIPEHAHAVGR